MSSEDNHHHHHHHHKTHKVLDKLASKISALKEDITDAVKERKHSTSSDRRNSMTSEYSPTNAENVTFTLQDDAISTTSGIGRTIRHDEESHGYGSISSPSSHVEPHSPTAAVPGPRHGINQLALNMGFGGIKPSTDNPGNVSVINTSKPSTASLASSVSNSSALLNASNPVSQPTITPTGSQQQFEFSDNISLNREYSTVSSNDLQERTITKVDPVDMTAKAAVEVVPNDPERRAALLLSGAKFELKSEVIPTDKLKLDNDTIYSVAIVVGVISLVIALWKPISTYFSGLVVGILFAGALFYIFVRMFITKKAEEIGVTEWVEFPALEAMLTKCDKEDKNTNLQVTGASMAFQGYDADRDDDFARYPCEIRLDGYRLIIQLASRQWNEEKKSEKEVKFIGYREYLVKEARMILVPEATLTRAKYWMNDYPIVIQDLQVLDKQISNKQLLEKSKMDANDFFTNTATVISIWFETGRQKEEWFHALSLTLCKGKEEIERKNSLISSGPSNTSLNTAGATPSLNRRLAQTDSDTELVSNPISETQIDQAILQTQLTAEELKQKAKIVEPPSDEVDASGTRRTAATQSKKRTPNEASLQKVLQSPECLDEAAITINFMARRLLSDMFDVPIFKDLIKTKVEMKLKEVAVSILKDLRVTSIDIGNTFPVILKIEPMQWNTQGIWFNLFLYYRGNFKLSVRTRVLLQKLINFDPKKDKPMFAQHHSAQIVHKDDERIDEDDLVSRQKLLAKEPEIPEMAITRKLGLKLTSLALNPYFQMIANIPFVKSLMEKFSESDVGADVEVTSFSGVLTLNIPPPPSDRLWVGFPEMPDLNIKVVPVYGENQYSYTLLQDFLSAKVRAELKRLVVLPAMDDQLLPFFRDWAIDIIGEIVKKPINPETDNYKARLQAQTSVAEGLKEYNKTPSPNRQSSTTSSTTETYL